MVVLGLVFLTFVAPLWIVFHYVNKWRTQKVLSETDQELLASLRAATVKMEERIQDLEKILRDHRREGS
jgi:phage shock protein B